MDRINIDVVSTNSKYDFSSLVSGVTISKSGFDRLYMSRAVKRIKYSSIDDSITVFLKEDISYEELKWEQ